MDFVRRVAHRQQSRSGTDTNGAADRMCVRSRTEWPVQQWNMSKWQILLKKNPAWETRAGHQADNAAEARFSKPNKQKQHKP